MSGQIDALKTSISTLKIGSGDGAGRKRRGSSEEKGRFARVVILAGTLAFMILCACHQTLPV